MGNDIDLPSSGGVVVPNEALADNSESSETPGIQGMDLSWLMCTDHEEIATQCSMSNSPLALQTANNFPDDNCNATRKFEWTEIKSRLRSGA